MNAMRFIAVMVFTIAACGCDSEVVSQSPTPPIPYDWPAVDGAQLNEVTIARKEYGDWWPFSVDRGVLTAKAVDLNGFGRGAIITFKSGDVEYALNGTAKRTHRYRAMEEIWLESSRLDDGTLLMKDIGPIIDRGQKLAQGINEPFVKPKPFVPFWEEASSDAEESQPTPISERKSLAFDAEEAERYDKEDSEKTKQVEAARVKVIEDAKFRTWTSRNGTFTLEAKLISLGMGIATLETREGIKKKVSIDKLGEADQAFINKWRHEKR